MSSVEQKIIGFLEGLGARVTPIKTESLENRRTPDLLVNFHDIEMVVEIKAIENNPEEVNAIKAVGSGEVVTVSHDNDVDRFARKIRDANNQLKSKCNGRPGLVFIADNRSFFTKSIAPQQMLSQAMFGEETLWLTAPDIAQPRPSRIVSHDFGLGRALGPRSNTTVSAVGLFVAQEGGLLLLHHNPHAAVPLSKGMFVCESVREFAIPSTRQFAEFEEIGKNGT